MAPAICESSLWFIWAKVGQRQVAVNSQAKLQTWPLSPPVGCHRPNIRPSPLYGKHLQIDSPTAYIF